MRFRNRQDAGHQLADKLEAFRDQRPVVLALPRGGVPVAAEIAEALDAPLDLILVRKIGVPFEPELAMGAVVDGGATVIVRNEDVIRSSGVSELEFRSVCDNEQAEIERRRERYLGNRERAEITGRVVIVVDDGVATGATARAALQAVRKRGPKKLILAVPVAATDSLGALEPYTDEIVCVQALEPFGSIGFYYSDFHQVTDEEVIEALDRFSPDGRRSARTSAS